jgi:hypothetical protein
MVKGTIDSRLTTLVPDQVERPADLKTGKEAGLATAIKPEPKPEPKPELIPEPVDLLAAAQQLSAAVGKVTTGTGLSTFFRETAADITSTAITSIQGFDAGNPEDVGVATLLTNSALATLGINPADPAEGLAMVDVEYKSPIDGPTTPRDQRVGEKLAIDLWTDDSNGLAMGGITLIDIDTENC